MKILLPLFLLCFWLEMIAQGPVDHASGGLVLCNPSSSIIENPARNQDQLFKVIGFSRLSHQLSELKSHHLQLSLSRGQKHYGLGLHQYGVQNFQAQTFQTAFGLALSENWSAGLRIDLARLQVVEQANRYNSQQHLFLSYSKRELWQWAQSFSHHSERDTPGNFIWNHQLALRGYGGFDLYLGAELSSSRQHQWSCGLEYQVRNMLFYRQAFVYRETWRYASGLALHWRSWSLSYSYQWQKFLGAESGISISYSQK